MLLPGSNQLTKVGHHHKHTHTHTLDYNIRSYASQKVENRSVEVGSVTQVTGHDVTKEILFFRFKPCGLFPVFVSATFSFQLLNLGKLFLHVPNLCLKPLPVIQTSMQACVCVRTAICSVASDAKNPNPLCCTLPKILCYL